MNVSATASVSTGKRAWSRYAFLVGPTDTLTDPLTDIRNADSHADSYQSEHSVEKPAALREKQETLVVPRRCLQYIESMRSFMPKSLCVRCIIARSIYMTVIVPKLCILSILQFLINENSSPFPMA